jgi:hypothetical protein
VQALRAAGDEFLPEGDADQREEELERFVERARNWPPDILEGLRDSEPDDLIVVPHPYQSARAVEPDAEPLGLLTQPE